MWIGYEPSGLVSQQVDVAVTNLNGVYVERVGRVRQALTVGQVVDLLVEGGGDGGVTVLFADNTAGQNECLAVGVEVIAGEDAVLGLVDGVLVVVYQGDFAPVFFKIGFGADADPVIGHGVFPFETVCVARGERNYGLGAIAIRVFFVWSLPYETHIGKWGTLES